MLSLLKSSSHKELGRDLGSRLLREELLQFDLLKRSPSFPAALPSVKKKKGTEGTVHDVGPSEMALQKHMSPDLLRKIAEMSFLSAEVRHEGLGHCSSQC